jgi:apolipoprotein N-acyltransferase
MLNRLSALALRRPGLTALLIGAASATGFAPLGLWPVTLVALALLLWLLEHAPRHRAAFGLGWLFGLGHFTIGNNWIATAFTFQAKMPAWLGWVAVPLLSLYLAVFIGLATWSAWAVWRALAAHARRHSRKGGNPTPAGVTPPDLELGPRLRGDDERGSRLALALLFAAAWTVTEWLRSWVFSGFAWNPLSAIWVALQSDSASVARLASPWIGSYGVSGLLVLFAGGMLQWPRSLSKQQRQRDIEEMEKSPGKTQLLWGGVLTAAVLFAIFLQNNRQSASTNIPITIVQPNIGQGDKYDMEARAANFRKLAALSPRREDQPPRLLLWPEAAVPDYLESGYPLDWYIEAPAFARAKLAGLLGPEDVLLTGAVKLDPTADGRDIAYARNSVFSLDARGTLGPRYDKSHLVPYGEYLPMRSVLSLFGISRLVPGSIDFRHGPGARSIDLGRFGKVGVQVCYEIIFSGQVVDRANRPAFLFNPSNDAWFGSWGPPQHLAQARLRAIEEGLPVIRATPTGISAIIDADGRVLDSIPAGVAGRIDSYVPAAHAPTLFARYGNILPLAFAVFLFGLAVVATIARPRRHR